MNRPPYSPKNGPDCVAEAASVAAHVPAARNACERRDRVVAAHERLADQHDVGARGAVVRDVGRLEHRRFGDRG